ncbi:hypothetical protein D6T63_15530 [Arthrobacter cheniae]|uniref:Uncharacterized protein n=1 Tax=Arthrobacter cheniae TaxID=1258888 RepID=A0A3A5M327_9MICC|nr:hypothetical protein [Arthrobacter cheniae]RJT77345.1 hypothetical protein D6T63_15530 [Arthrobacter cheniae]
MEIALVGSNVRMDRSTEFFSALTSSARSRALLKTDWGAREPIGVHVEGKLSFRFPAPFALTFEKCSPIDSLGLFTFRRDTQLRRRQKRRRAARWVTGLL